MPGVLRFAVYTIACWFCFFQIYYERINSHVGSATFDFKTCGVKDVSKTLIDLEKYPSAKIFFTKRISFASNEAEEEFERQRSRFLRRLRTSETTTWRRGRVWISSGSTSGTRCSSFRNPYSLPWFVSGPVFWIASVLLLSWPIRVLIQSKTAYVHFYVHKLFGCQYLDPNDRDRSRLLRENTSESVDLDRTGRKQLARWCPAIPRRCSWTFPTMELRYFPSTSSQSRLPYR